jgi:hypothetical protein
MIVLIVCLVASIAIAIVRLSTTPHEILGDGFHGLPAHRAAIVSAGSPRGSE